LEASLTQPLPDAVRRLVEQQLAALREQRAALLHIGPGAQVGDVNVGDMAGRDIHKPTAGTVTLSDDARIDGVAVGLNLGTIIYGRAPEEDERRRLAWYLARLAGKLSRLPLRGLEARLDQGDGVALAHIYVTLAVQSRLIAAAHGPVAKLRNRFEDDDIRNPLRREYSADYTLPMAAVIGWARDEQSPQGRQTFPLAELAQADLQPIEGLLLWRSFLASEVVEYHRQRCEAAKVSYQVVLLGDPGSGKSTFLRHLAWALGRRGLDQADAAGNLFGWQPDRRVLPIFLPLRTLSRRIATDGAAPMTVFRALRDEMHACCMHDVDDLLSASLASGSALLLFDGLDEVPLEAQPTTTASRRETLQAIRAFVQLHEQTQVVLTCRTRAFDAPSRDLLGWPVETLAPFTLGQIRHFARAWYQGLVSKQQITTAQADQLSAALIDAIVHSPKLRAMAETPLLLTMMALVLFNKGELPCDRPQLYERILELLLGEWDKVRDGQNLAEAVGIRDWGSERFQPLLDQLSYEAHLRGTSQDGRGRLSKGELRDALIAYFEAAEVGDAWGAARRCLDYFEQRSGLVAPDGPQSYVFAHLTLQEHCAGRHIALNSDDPVALAMQHRSDDRWREPIFLGAGLLRPAELNSLLADLIDRGDSDQPKEIARWHRDLILAAEIGNDRDWSYLRTRPMVKVDRLQRDLRAGLAALLNDKAQPLPTAERVRAGFLLGDLGDPRFPVTIEEWQAELARAGEPGSYFCRVEPGEYIIGSSDDDPDAKAEEKPQHRFTLAHPLLIARYPITNAQWQAWVVHGGQPSYSADDSDHNRPNQAIVSVN
jgi:energy-coupling factor transporter ATP-binding protein EcfA2